MKNIKEVCGTFFCKRKVIGQIKVFGDYHNACKNHMVVKLNEEDQILDDLINASETAKGK